MYNGWTLAWGYYRIEIPSDSITFREFQWTITNVGANITTLRYWLDDIKKKHDITGVQSGRNVIGTFAHEVKVNKGDHSIGCEVYGTGPEYSWFRVALTNLDFRSKTGRRIPVVHINDVTGERHNVVKANAVHECT